MEVLNIQLLSKSVKPELIHGEMTPTRNDVVEEVKGYMMYILRYLYKYDQEAYEALKSNGLLDQFKNMSCFKSNSFYVKYCINGTTRRAQQSVLLFEGNLYIQDDVLEDAILVEISKLFNSKTTLIDFIIALLARHSSNKINGYLSLRNITELPIKEREFFDGCKIQKPQTTQPDNGSIIEKEKTDEKKTVEKVKSSTVDQDKAEQKQTMQVRDKEEPREKIKIKSIIPREEHRIQLTPAD
jgi:hypothetical protein